MRDDRQRSVPRSAPRSALRSAPLTCIRRFALRTAARDAVHKQNAGARAMMDMGVDTWEHAFIRVPDGGRSLAQQPGPKDAMHVWLEGLTKTNAAATLFMMVRVHGWCTQAQMRRRFKTYQWPKEKAVSRPGYLPPKLFTGTGKHRACGDSSDLICDIIRPQKTMHMPFTAHHMLVWTLHSIELLRPFLPPDAMEHPFWRAWVHQVDILTTIMAPTFTYQSLLRLEGTLKHSGTVLRSCPSSLPECPPGVTPPECPPECPPGAPPGAPPRSAPRSAPPERPPGVTPGVTPSTIASTCMPSHAGSGTRITSLCPNTAISGSPSTTTPCISPRTFGALGPRG